VRQGFPHISWPNDARSVNLGADTEDTQASRANAPKKPGKIVYNLAKSEEPHPIQDREREREREKRFILLEKAVGRKERLLTQ
jgi:hypothetical protein